VLFQSRGRPDTLLPIRCRLLLSPGVSPSPGFSFGGNGTRRMHGRRSGAGVAAEDIVGGDRGQGCLTYLCQHTFGPHRGN